MNSWRQKRSVMRRYNLTSKMYDERYRDEQEAKYRAALADLKVNSDSMVLDVGCGSGMFFSYIAKQAKTVVGIDVSRGLLVQAQERSKKNQNVSLVLADADHLPFKPAVFNFVFLFTLLQNMPKPAETLGRLKTVAFQDACYVVTGLKAALSLEALGDLLHVSGLQPVSIRNDDSLRCNVVQCIQRQ